MANWVGKLTPASLEPLSPSTLMFGISISAIGIPVGNALLISGLRNQVPRLAHGIPPEAVIRNGPLNLQALTKSPSLLHGLREAYAIAISHVNIFLVVLVCVSVPTAGGMKWLNIKEVSKRNEEEKRSLRAHGKPVGSIRLGSFPSGSGENAP